MAKGSRGWNSSQTAQNSMLSKIDRTNKRSEVKSKKELFSAIVENNIEQLRERTFSEIYPTFGSWESELIEIMGIMYYHILKEMWEYSNDVPKVPGGPRNWVRDNYFADQLSPKMASRKLREKVYG